MACHDPNAILELSFVGSDLSCKDLLSKSDPMLILYDVTAVNSLPTELGRTEYIKNCQSPKFAAKIRFDYFFERLQKLKIKVIDIDDDSINLQTAPIDKIKHELIGEIEFNASELIRGSKGVKEFGLVSAKNKKSGKITVTTRNMNKNEVLTIQFAASNLDKKDFFGKADPYLIINRVNSSGDKIQVFKTKHLKNTLDPVWPSIDLAIGHIADFNSGDHMNSPIVIDCYDWNRTSKDDYIGSVNTNLYQLLNSKENMELINPAKAKSGKKGVSGLLTTRMSKVTSQHSFADYLNAGTQISLAIAIDFTGSNGAPQDPNSLHHINTRGGWNPYMFAIHSVGSVLCPYDADNKIPVFGFGAVLSGSKNAVHDFHVNFNPQDPHVFGLSGVMGAYANCISQIALSGPTFFAPVITKHMKAVRDTLSTREYHILLIITDGIIVDMPQTKNAIAEAAELPISIVIVGVGSADFTDMHSLDNDNMVLTDSAGKLIPRDIVQFVEMRKFGPEDFNAFAAEVLREIPNQFLDYMHRHNVQIS